jgi:hypothetical protein
MLSNQTLTRLAARYGQAYAEAARLTVEMVGHVNPYAARMFGEEPERSYSKIGPKGGPSPGRGGPITHPDPLNPNEGPSGDPGYPGGGGKDIHINCFVEAEDVVKCKDDCGSVGKCLVGVIPFINEDGECDAGCDCQPCPTDKTPEQWLEDF